MSKIESLVDIGSLANTTSARAAINQNFESIEQAFENTISRDGSQPNQMEADFDLNDHYLLNVADPVNEADGVNLRSVRPLVQQFAAEIVETAVFGTNVFDSFTATAGQDTFALTASPGSIENTLVVVDGLTLRPGTDYTLAGPTLQSLVLVVPALGGEEIGVHYAKALPSGVEQAQNVTYTPPSTSVGGTVRSFLDALWSTGADAGAKLVRWIGSKTGMVARTVEDKLRETITVKDFGAVGDGIVDDTAALQAAITRASADGFDLLWPDGTYVVTGNLTQTGVLVMGALSKYGRVRIVKSGTGDLFSGESAVLSNLILEHQGTSGRILNLTGDGARVEGCSLTNAAANSSEMVRFTRSDHYFGRNYVTNNNASAYSILVERTSAGICINGAIENRNVFGGIGRGVRFTSSVAAARPEGWSFKNNTVILTGDRHLTLESMLHLSVTGNVLDQGTGTSIDFAPNTDSIDSVTIADNYIATAAAPLTGVGLNTQGGTGSIFNLRVVNNHFEQCDYALALNPKVAEFVVEGNTFANINTESVRYSGAVRGTIANNTFRGANTHLQLIDGATGVAIAVVGNVFPSTGSVAATFTDRTRFEFRGNVGKKFEGWASATVALNVTGGVALSIPHGLALTPNIDRIAAAVSQVTGDHTDTTIKVGSVDATNVNIGVYGTVNVAGNLRANIYVSV